MIHTEPNWKSYLVETTEPIFLHQNNVTLSVD
jgi:hypothetical protein